MASTPDADDALDARLANRAERFQASKQPSFKKVNAYQVNNDSLEMRPAGASQPHGTIPNTPAMVSLISFLLGTMFAFSLVVFAQADLACLWAGHCDESGSVLTPRLGFFMGAWSAFHWGEFAVTAQWNREKVSVDCELPRCFSSREANTLALVDIAFLLDNGYQYHLAHGIALTEYLITTYLRPQWKSFPYISVLGSSMRSRLTSI